MTAASNSEGRKRATERTADSNATGLREALTAALRKRIDSQVQFSEPWDNGYKQGLKDAIYDLIEILTARHHEVSS